VVAEHFIGGETSVGGWDYGGWRCVIGVRSVYPGKQARILFYEVLQEAKKTAGKVVCRAQSFVGHELQSDHR